MEIYDGFDISSTTIANLYNLGCGGKYFFIRFRNVFPMLVFTFLLYGGLIQMMFLLRCFLSLPVFIFARYLSLYLTPDLSNASWYGITTSLKISPEEDNDEIRGLIEIGSFLFIDGRWLDSVFMYFTLFYFLW